MACVDGACKSGQSCTAGWKCPRGNVKGFQNADCTYDFATIEFCDGNCVDGQCVVECTDQGQNANVKETCTDSAGTHIDFCESSTLVRDWYCGGTWDGSTWTNIKCNPGGYGCANGCSDGACI